MGTREDGHYGLAGVLVRNRTKAWASFSTVPPKKAAKKKGYFSFPAGTRFSRFELHYQGFPGGGPIKVEIDGANTQMIESAADQVADKLFVAELEDGAHSVKVSTEKKETRLYGVAFERSEGFVIDALMIIGGWAHSFLNYDPAHLREQVEQRNPDLVIFQFGAKEAYLHPDFTDREVADLVRDFSYGVNRTMAGRPEASCLIVSPKDMGIKKKKKIVTRTAIPRIVRGNQKVARRTGCAFFNLFEAIGGKGTMKKWRRKKPPWVSEDFGHLMDEGAIKTGDFIAAALLEQYERYLRKLRKRPP
jgi:hypothetical protein